MPLVIPPRPKPGSAIGLVCPAASAADFAPSVWKAGELHLKAKGFNILPGRTVRTRLGHSSGTIEDRLLDIHEMFLNPDVGLVLAALGGFSSHQLLPFLDFDLIRTHPKPLVGFSDITALLIGIYAKTSLVTFLGPVFGTFCQKELPLYTEGLFDDLVLHGKTGVVAQPSNQWADDPWYQCPDDPHRRWVPNPGWVVHREGVAYGSAIGGNLSTLLLLAGTSFLPSFDNAVLFIEDDDETTPAQFNRGLTHLRHLGIFDVITGLAIGRFPQSVVFPQDDTLAATLECAMQGTNFPIVSGLDFGHTDPLMTIPIGTKVCVEPSTQTVRFIDRATI